MKPNKSPESTEVTPSKKKLKQARLPFKVISDVSPSPLVPQTRKRKLSEPDSEPVTKVGRLSKENDLAEELVVISDDESKNTLNEDGKSANPYVKLVDAAWKKKLQKSKTSKKKKNERKHSKDMPNGSLENRKNVESYGDQVKVEMMDVDEPVSEDKTVESPAKNTGKKDADKSSKISPKQTTTKKSLRSSIKSDENEIITLEDSNNSSDVNIDKSKHNELSINTTDKQEVAPNQVSKRESPRKKCPKSESPSKSPKKPKSSKNETDSHKSPSKESPQQNASPKEIESNEMVTPKRSTRNKTKVEEKINTTPSYKLDKSVSSTPSTPKSSSATKSQGGSISESSTPTMNLTPKQLQKKHESVKKREDREKEKLEREKKKQQEKEERAKQKQEKEDQRKREREEKEEAKRKEKEEKEEQKRKEREEKEQQKELEKKLKEEKEEQKRKEREEKEDQKRKEREAKEEERRKKHEALDLEKQEQELKKKKAAEAFANFFVPKQKEKDHGTVVTASMNNMLSSFTIKVDMRLAPTRRVKLSDEQREDLTNFIQSQKENDLYVKRLKAGKCKPLSSGKTWPLTDKDDDDVMIVEDELPPIEGAEIITCESAQKEKLRPKLISFHDNRRPPYWGTWRKRSQFIKPRNPFGQEKSLDYDVDSGDDWEDEAEGESLDGSMAASDDEQENDEYEVDNDMFVPHGYLSDEEATMDEDDVLSLSPETQKERLKHLEDEFESELKKPTEKLKPRQYGILWETKDGGKPEKCVDALWNYFCKFAMIMDDPTPLLQPAKETEDTEKKKSKKKKQRPKDGEQSPMTEKKKKTKPEKQECKKPKVDAKKNTPEVKKNQPGINSFLKKITNTT